MVVIVFSESLCIIYNGRSKQKSYYYYVLVLGPPITESIILKFEGN